MQPKISGSYAACFVSIFSNVHLTASLNKADEREGRCTTVGQLSPQNRSYPSRIFRSGAQDSHHPCQISATRYRPSVLQLAVSGGEEVLVPAILVDALTHQRLTGL